MLVSDIAMRVKRTFGDEAGVQLTDDDIIRWINDGQRAIVLQNETLLETTAIASSVAAQAEYALPVDLLIPRGVSFKASGNQSYRSLRGMTRNEFNEYIEAWDGSTNGVGTPEVFMLFGGKVTFFPIPDTSTAASIKYFYNQKPIPVVSQNDTPGLPELYHETLVKYVLLQAYEMDEDVEAASAKGAQMSADLNLLRGREDWKNEETYPIIMVRDEDR